MSLITRIIAYIGISLIMLVVLFSAWLAYTNDDFGWRGIFTCTFFIALLVFFAHTLRKGARQERHPEQKTFTGMGWGSESVSSFLFGPLLHTPEGWVVLIGSIVSIIFGLLAQFAPSLIALTPTRPGIPIMFYLWPVILFVVYVKRALSGNFVQVCSTSYICFA